MPLRICLLQSIGSIGLNVQRACPELCRREDITNKGRIDLSLRMGQHVNLFEFKVIEGNAQGKALQQLIDQGYADKFRESGVSITLIGIEFSKTERNIVGVEVKTEP